MSSIITKTDKQVEIKRLEENHESNYRIVWGNPLTAEKDGEIYGNMLSINGYGMATSYIELSQYQKEIEIHKTGNSVNIKLID